jgi:hypothetical protein
VKLVPRSKNAWSYASILPIRLHGVVLLFREISVLLFSIFQKITLIKGAYFSNTCYRTTLQDSSAGGGQRFPLVCNS